MCSKDVVILSVALRTMCAKMPSVIQFLTYMAPAFLNIIMKFGKKFS